MTEWWTYRLSDLLMFSARTYYRMFELYNAEVWPGHLVVLGAGAAIAVLGAQRSLWAARVACALLAAGWFWVAWAFHAQRYAQINSAAPWFGAAFAVEGALLLVFAALAARSRDQVPLRLGRVVGFGLLLFALVVQPALGALFGRPWQQAEVFGLAPDPTAVFTLGLLLVTGRFDAARAARPRPAWAWALWPLPLLWCAISGATLWAMQAPDALVLPAAALLAGLAAPLVSPRPGAASRAR